MDDAEVAQDVDAAVYRVLSLRQGTERMYV